MATRMNRTRLEFATVGFLTEMRRQFAILHPGVECPIRNFADYDSKQKSALMAAVEKSITLSSDSSDRLFAAWAERKAAESA